MARRTRHSRLVPYVMSTDEKRNFLKGLARDDELREAVETLLDVNLSEMTGDEQIKALRAYEDANFATAEIASLYKSRQDVLRLARNARGEIESRDKVALLEEKVTVQNEQIATLQNELAEARSTGKAGRK